MKNIMYKIKKSVLGLIANESDQKMQFVGVLGNHDGTVDAGDGLVYMTLHNGQVMRLVNKRVPNIAGRSVVAGYDPMEPNLLQVLYFRGVYGDDDTQPLVADHHETHEFPGHDTVWVKQDQFLPLLVLPAEDFTVQVYGGVFRKSDSTGWAIIQNQQVDLSSYVPTAGALYVLIDADNSGALSVVSGTLVDSVDVLDYDDLPEPSNIPIVYIRLYDGQDQVRREANFNDFVDPRFSGFVGTTSSALFDYIDFNTSWSGTMQEGRLAWDTDNGTAQLGMPGGVVNQQLGMEIFTPRGKAIGSNINNGQLIYISGASGSKPEMTLAKADASATSKGTIAMATEDITENQFGYYTAIGEVREIPVPTATFSDGDILYLSDATAGSFTNVSPVAPSFIIKIGYVMRAHNTEGVVFVAINQRSNAAKHINIIDAGGYYDSIEVEAALQEIANEYARLDLTNQPFKSLVNSTTAFQVQQSDSTPVFNVDTVNGRVGIGTDSPEATLDVAGTFLVDSELNTTMKIENNFVSGVSFSLVGTSKHLYFKPASEYTVFLSNSTSSTMQIENGGSGYSQIRFYGSSDNRIVTYNGNLTITPKGNLTVTKQLVVEGSSDITQSIIQAHSTQTANILEIQKSDGSVLSGVDERGILFSHGGSDPTNLFLGNNTGNIATNGVRGISLGNYAGSRQTTLDDLLIIDNQLRADIATELTNSILYGVMGATPDVQSLRVNARLTTSQGRVKSTETSTSTATMSDTVEVHFCDSTTPYSLTLPTNEAGKEIKVINKNTGLVTLIGDLIMGETSQALNQYDTIILVGDGTNWF